MMTTQASGLTCTMQSFYTVLVYKYVTGFPYDGEDVKSERGVLKSRSMAIPHKLLELRSGAYLHRFLIGCMNTIPDSGGETRKQ